MSDIAINSDLALTARILAGERELYAVIVQRYNQRLYKVGIAILNDSTDVEDAMQVTYVNAYLNLSKFEAKSSFATWLTKIMVNECLLRLKKQKKGIHMEERITGATANDMESVSHTPMTELLHSELRSIIDEGICKLPEIYRTVFVMREIEEMSVAETQECLGISAVNVKVRLNRAKALLRAYLAAYYRRDDLLHFHLLRCDKMVDGVIRKLGIAS